MGERSEFEAMQREVAELRKCFADVERESREEIRLLENRVEALEQSVQELNPGLNLKLGGI